MNLQILHDLDPASFNSFVVIRAGHTDLPSFVFHELIFFNKYPHDNDQYVFITLYYKGHWVVWQHACVFLWDASGKPTSLSFNYLKMANEEEVYNPFIMSFSFFLEVSLSLSSLRMTQTILSLRALLEWKQFLLQDTFNVILSWILSCCRYSSSFLPNRDNVWVLSPGCSSHTRSEHRKEVFDNTDEVSGKVKTPGCATLGR